MKVHFFKIIFQSITVHRIIEILHQMFLNVITFQIVEFMEDKHIIHSI